MFNFKISFLNIFFKFEVISDLPGRVRLRVNNYKKIPQEALKYESYAVEAIKKLDGVEEVTFNPVIGTILIEYNKYKLTSKEIVNWLNAVKKLVAENMDVISSLEGKSEKEAKDILFSVLDNFMKNR